MDLQAVLTEIRSWPAEDRLRLIEEVWDGLSDDESEGELSTELKDLLDRRLEAADRNPAAAVAWAIVEAGALERFRSEPDAASSRASVALRIINDSAAAVGPPSWRRLDRP